MKGRRHEALQADEQTNITFYDMCFDIRFFVGL